MVTQAGGRGGELPLSGAMQASLSGKLSGGEDQTWRTIGRLRDRCEQCNRRPGGRTVDGTVEKRRGVLRDVGRGRQAGCYAWSFRMRSRPGLLWNTDTGYEVLRAAACRRVVESVQRELVG